MVSNDAWKASNHMVVLYHVAITVMENYASAVTAKLLRGRSICWPQLMYALQSTQETQNS